MNTVGLSPDEERLVLDAATAAPSMHNAQPWRFVVHPDRIDVVPDTLRALPAEDPELRMLALGCGAAVLNARLALNHLGYAARLDLVPGEAPLPICRLSIVGPRFLPAWEAMYAVVPVRRTNRFPFRDEPVPDSLLDELRQAAAREDARLDVLADADDRARLLAFVHAGDAADRDDDARAVERSRWIAEVPERGEGVPHAALGPVAADDRTPVRDLAPGMDILDRATLRFERASAVALLITHGDTPADWVYAGMALQRMLLTGTVRGLAFSLANQPLEHRELRQRVTRAFCRVGHPQAVLRIGYPTTSVAATPRRPACEDTETTGTPVDADVTTS